MAFTRTGEFLVTRTIGPAFLLPWVVRAQVTNGDGAESWPKIAQFETQEDAEFCALAFAAAAQGVVHVEGRICGECGGRDGHKSPFCRRLDLSGVVGSDSARVL